MRKVVGFIFTLASVLMGCVGDESSPADVPEVEEESCTPTPPSTQLMQYDWALAESKLVACRWETGNSLEDCRLQAAGDEVKESECHVRHLVRYDQCQYIWAERLNRIPVRTCNLKIFATFDNSAEGESYRIELIDGDFDGDGLSNYDEMLIGMNPCEEYSFGTCNPADSELDYDADGNPNGTDPSDRCNLDDPAGWQSDCA